MHVLFDTGTTHSFISISCAYVLRFKIERIENMLYIESPMGIKTLTEVTDDKKVIKKILKEWEEYEHPNGVVVKLKLMGKLQDGTID